MLFQQFYCTFGLMAMIYYWGSVYGIPWTWFVSIPHENIRSTFIAKLVLNDFDSYLFLEKNLLSYITLSSENAVLFFNVPCIVLFHRKGRTLFKKFFLSKQVLYEYELFLMETKSSFCIKFVKITEYGDKSDTALFYSQAHQWQVSGSHALIG